MIFEVKRLQILYLLFTWIFLFQIIFIKVGSLAGNNTMYNSIDCQKCGNTHCGSCSTEAIYFYWYPQLNQNNKEVYIIGDWSQWQKKQLMSVKQSNNKTNYFTICLILSPGRHQYKFLVDGIWRYSNNNPKIDNNMGSFNNIVEIWPKKTYIQKYPNCLVKLSSNFIIDNLKIIGSWDDWTAQRSMKKTFNNLKGCEQNIIQLNLQANKTYQFKLKIGHQYLVDQKYPTIVNIYGTLNNYIIVYEKIIRVETTEKKKIEDIYNQGKKYINGKVFRWKNVECHEDIPYERVEGHTMCSVGQYIYIFGGKSRSQFYHSLIKIDSKFDKIQFEDIVPDGRAFHIMQVYGNKIIIYGGHNNAVLGDYHTFNVVQRKWQSTPIFNHNECKYQKHSCVIYQNLLIFFAGHNNSTNEESCNLSNELTVLDLQKMQWIDNIKILGQKPKGRFSHTGAIIQSEMFIFGGITFYCKERIQNQNDLWKINLKDVNLLHWQKILPKGKAPAPRHGHTMNALQNILIIFGGIKDNNQMLNDLMVYDSITNEWISPIIQGGGTPQPRYNHAATNFINDQIVIFGGKIQNNNKNKSFHILIPQNLISRFDENDDYPN